MESMRKLKKRARQVEDDLRIILKKARKAKLVDSEEIERLEGLAADFKDALAGDDREAITEKLEDLNKTIERDFAAYRPNPVWETFKALFIALLIALAIRWLFIEPFRIPSGSMIPTLLIGDQLLVDKTSFGPDLLLPTLETDLDTIKKTGTPRFSFNLFGSEVTWVYKKIWMRRLPRRGEIVVFRFPGYPNGPYEDYIKRVIGLPGDVVEIRERRLYVNNELQPEVLVGEYDGPVGEGGCSGFQLFDETLASELEPAVHQVLHCEPMTRTHPYYSYGPVTVPEDMLLGMGDNRDRSSDSRHWGFIPVSHLKGTALVIHLPLDPERNYMPRWDRFFKKIR